MSAPPPAVNVTICTCEGDHVAAITTIYAHHVLYGLASIMVNICGGHSISRDIS